MIRIISFIAIFVILAFPKLSFAQQEMCEVYYPKGSTKIQLTTNKSFGQYVTNSNFTGSFYTRSYRPYASPEAMSASGLYYADNSSTQTHSIFGSTRRCGAKITISNRTKFGISGYDLLGSPIEGCPYGELINDINSALSYAPYSTPIDTVGGGSFDVMSKQTAESLVYTKRFETKQTEPAPMDIFSMGWFSTNDDSNEMAADWRSVAGEMMPMGYANSIVLAGYQNICYYGSRWSVWNFGEIYMDDSSLNYGGKKWREFYVEVTMYQTTCGDCVDAYDDYLWNRESPAGTTASGGYQGSQGGGVVTPEEPGAGEASQTLCSPESTTAGCTELGDPTTQVNAIPSIPYEFNDPGAAPSFASPWDFSAGSAECPANIKFRVNGANLSDLEFDEMCGMIAGPFRAVLLLIASLTALAIAIPKP